MIPIEITNLKSLKISISNTKKWELNEYVCKLYKDFISSLGWINLFRFFKYKTNQKESDL